MANNMQVGRMTSGIYVARFAWNDASFQAQGRLVADTLGEMQAMRDNFRSLRPGEVVTIVHPNEPEMDGWYYIERAEVADENGTLGQILGTAFQLTAQRIGKASEVCHQTRLTGKDLTTGHTVSAQEFVGYPVSEGLYPPGTLITRTARNIGGTGDESPYVDIAADRTKTYLWDCDPDDYNIGAAYIKWANTTGGATRWTRQGYRIPNIPRDAWTIGNGLVEAAADDTDPGNNLGFLLRGHNGSGSWSEWGFRLTTDGASFNAVTLAANAKPFVRRNTPECCIIGFTMRRTTGAGGLYVVELGVRRGSRFIWGHIYRDTTNQLGLARSSTDAASDNGDGSVEDSTSGSHWVIATEQARTASGNGGLYLTTTGTDLYFMAGHVISGASTGDTRADLVAQYHGWAEESITPRAR